MKDGKAYNQVAQRASAQPKIDKHLLQSQGDSARATAQKKPSPFVRQPAQNEANKTGLPDNLKSGIESLSGMDMSDVKVHYNSDKPSQLQAHAYAQGTDIHLASGQEKHLPHEAWHVVQQKQGRVQPTTQMKGTQVNDDSSLESEADAMGTKALQMKAQDSPAKTYRSANHKSVAQCYVQKGSFKISQNGRYKTNDVQKHKLWVNKAKATPPMPSKFFKKMSSEAEWDIYEPLAKLDGKEHNGLKGENQCGYYAAALAHNENDWTKGHALASMYDAHTAKMYGTSGQKTKDFDKDFKKMGNSADPSVGEAYFLYGAPEGDRDGAYHAGAVVAEDGEDNITSEANVNDEGRKVPYFEMYGTKNKEQTFLGRYGEAYSSKNSRNINKYDARVAHLITKTQKNARETALGWEEYKKTLDKTVIEDKNKNRVYQPDALRVAPSPKAHLKALSLSATKPPFPKKK